MNPDAFPQPKKQPSALESLPSELHVGGAKLFLGALKEILGKIQTPGPFDQYKLILIERLLKDSVIDTAILATELDKKDGDFNISIFRKACADLEKEIKSYPEPVNA